MLIVEGHTTGKTNKTVSWDSNVGCLAFKAVWSYKNTSTTYKLLNLYKHSIIVEGKQL